MFVDANVNGGYIKALVDIDASHNFLNEGEFRKLGIQYTTHPGLVKVNNYLFKHILSISYIIPLKVT